MWLLAHLLIIEMASAGSHCYYLANTERNPWDSSDMFIEENLTVFFYWTSKAITNRCFWISFRLFSVKVNVFTGKITPFGKSFICSDRKSLLNSSSNEKIKIRIYLAKLEHQATIKREERKTKRKKERKTKSVFSLAIRKISKMLYSYWTILKDEKDLIWRVIVRISIFV